MAIHTAWPELSPNIAVVGEMILQSFKVTSPADQPPLIYYNVEHQRLSFHVPGGHEWLGERKGYSTKFRIKVEELKRARSPFLKISEFPDSNAISDLNVNFDGAATQELWDLVNTVVSEVGKKFGTEGNIPNFANSGIAKPNSLMQMSPDLLGQCEWVIDETYSKIRITIPQGLKGTKDLADILRSAYKAKTIRSDIEGMLLLIEDTLFSDEEPQPGRKRPKSTLIMAIAGTLSKLGINPLEKKNSAAAIKKGLRKFVESGGTFTSQMKSGKLILTTTIEMHPLLILALKEEGIPIKNANSTQILVTDTEGIATFVLSNEI